MAMERESLELLDKELNCLSERSPGKFKVCIFLIAHAKETCDDSYV